MICEFTTARESSPIFQGLVMPRLAEVARVNSAAGLV